MSSTSNISGLVSNLQPTSGTPQRIGGRDSDGDNDSSAGKTGKSSFKSLIEQVLDKSSSENTGASSATSSSSKPAPSNPMPDPQVAMQAFMHSLMATLQQAGGQSSAAAGADGNGDNDDSSSAVGKPRGSNMAANIQGLMQQLSANGLPTNPQGTNALGNLNSNFLNLINSIAPQGQMPPSSPSGAAPSNSTPDPQVAMQAFMHSLMATLQQAGGQSFSATGADGNGDNDGSLSAIGKSRNSNMAANIQGLLQQLSANSTLTSPQGANALGNLNSNFQNLINSIAPQGQASVGAASNAPTLQLFLQNLYQDVGSGQNASGASINAKA